MTLVLASSSPRRRDLLAAQGYVFRVVPSGVEERDPLPGEDPGEYALALARLKAGTVAANFPGHVILAADTVVSIAGQFLGKPGDAEDALRMLRLLRGREHTVVTGVVVRRDWRVREGVRGARVTMRHFPDDEARGYIGTGEPMDKAGAYAVQEYGGTFVERVDGCYNAVVGLPLALTGDMLAQFGIRPTAGSE